MNVNKETIVRILSAMNDNYPMPLGIETYKELEVELGSDLLLDGYLLYLADKNLIQANMQYVSALEQWQVNTDETRINAFGIDYLQQVQD